MATGGMTVAYNVVDYGPKDPGGADVVFNVALCSNKDLFCYQTGRKTAMKRMKAEGTVEVLPGDEHPRSKVIVDWIANNFFPDRLIVVKEKANPTKGRYRWVSTFK